MVSVENVNRVPAIVPAPTKDLAPLTVHRQRKEEHRALLILINLAKAFPYFDGAGAAGALTFTFTFVELPPPNSRPLKTYAAAKITITKITSTATTPALPPPSPLSPIDHSFRLCRGIGETDRGGCEDC